VTARSRRNERSRKRKRISSALRWQHPSRLRTPTGTGSETLPWKSANGSRASRRRENQTEPGAGAGTALPLVAITRVVTGPKIKTVPQRVKRWLRWASRWSGVTVRGDRTRYASRWSAVGRCGLTTKKEFGLDRDGLLMEAATARKRYHDSSHSNAKIKIQIARRIGPLAARPGHS
jgi:hypothetical protein